MRESVFISCAHARRRICSLLEPLAFLSLMMNRWLVMVFILVTSTYWHNGVREVSLLLMNILTASKPEQIIFSYLRCVMIIEIWEVYLKIIIIIFSELHTTLLIATVKHIFLTSFPHLHSLVTLDVTYGFKNASLITWTSYTQRCNMIYGRTAATEHERLSTDLRHN
jgi:hypothetical protein